MATIVPSDSPSQAPPPALANNDPEPEPEWATVSDSYKPRDALTKLTWRLTWDKEQSLFKFIEFPTGEAQTEENTRVQSQGGWGYGGYFKMLSLTSASGKFALPPMCEELTLIMEYKIKEGEATGAMGLVSEDDLPEEERDYHTLQWDKTGLKDLGIGPKKLKSAPLFGLRLEGGDLGRADLRNAALYASNCKNCNFTQADMRGSNLSQVDFRGSKFQFTQMSGCVLNGVRIRGCTFDGTYLEGAKSVENVKEWDPLVLKTNYHLDDGKEHYEDEDEGEDEGVAEAKAIRRLESISGTEKDRLKSLFGELLASNVESNDTMKPPLFLSALTGSGFSLDDVEKEVDATLSLSRLPSDDEKDHTEFERKNEKMKMILGKLRKLIHRQRERVFHDKIHSPTIHYVPPRSAGMKGLRERWKFFLDHARRDPQHLKRCADECRDVHGQLYEMRGAIVAETWVDQVDEWKELCQLQRGQSSERAMAVLRSVFEDKEVMRSLGLAEQFRRIRGAPPQGLIMKLKEGLAGHIKKNYFLYKRALDDELNNIKAIEAVQQWIVAMKSSAFVALLIGLSNFLSQIIINKMCNSTESSYCPVN
ncbi:hypothetical protein TrST_g7956 [Triparma strigata]|uniref:Uncharacterized protein n=1 Tax=Triparma strigata TaxID=1606541 RepID=A0A9W7EW38_9STRA|nr:hypothetical protein TrST_g7956 [Triparma strigata]